MVDASVGTDSDKFYRSKKTTKVQADLKKKQVKTSSTSVGTDPGAFTCCLVLIVDLCWYSTSQSVEKSFSVKTFKNF